ncbi:MAG: hypothetical protein K6F76_06485 [Clostridiales bacterium]|nr:hypothetical protein [Clostridiales bacterium]
MVSYVTDPNLPCGKVNTVIADADDCLINTLRCFGISVIKTQSCKTLPFFEQRHADMQCIHLGNNRIIIAKGCEYLILPLSNLGFDVITADCELKEAYPENVLLNGCIAGDKLICNPSTLSKCVLSLYDENKIIKTKQGYSKCSVAVVSYNAVITADEGIFKVCTDNKIDCLKIKPGYIKLEGVNYGFIGGCSGKLGKDILCFNGDLSTHPNYEDIKSFTRNYGVYTENLGQYELYDIGGILPVLEE